jgi:hypothetical protein
MKTYFLKNSVNHLTKIGKTYDMEKRLKAIRGQCQFVELSVFHVMNGDYEAAFHKFYAKRRQDGEWFDLAGITVEDLEDVRSLFVPKARQRLPFVKIYDCFSSIACKIKSVSSIRLLAFLLFEGPSKRGELLLDKALFLRFNAHLADIDPTQQITMRSFSRCVEELKTTTCLTRIRKGCYYLNPYFFWSDSEAERVELITEGAKEDQFIAQNAVEP